MASLLSQGARDYGIKIYAKDDDPHGPYFFTCPCGDHGPNYARLSRCQRVADAHYLVMHNLTDGG